MERAVFLESIEISGLPGFPTLSLDRLLRVSTFVGPNGAGKSTVLRALHLALSIVAKKTVCDVVPKHTAWEAFSSARLTFRASHRRPTKLLPEHLGADHEIITIDILCAGKQFFVSAIQCDDHRIEFDKNTLATRQHLTELEAALKQTEARLLDTNKLIREGPPNQRDQHEVQVRALTQTLTAQRNDYDLRQKVGVRTVASELPLTLERRQVDDVLAGLDLPHPVHVPARQSPETSVPKLMVHPGF